MGGSRREGLILAWTLTLFPAHFACVAPDIERVALVAEQRVRIGDLIFRKGRGLVSDLAMSVSLGERRFSHVGIVAQRGKQLVVVHAVQDIDYGRDGVVLDSIAQFLNEAEDWAVYRLNVPSNVRLSVAELALASADAALTFDSDFDLTTEDRVYCTELVWRIVNKAAGSELIRSSLTLGERNIVSVSDIYLGDTVEFVVGADSGAQPNLQIRARGSRSLAATP